MTPLRTLLLLLALALGAGLAPARAQEAPPLPANILPEASQSDMWRAIRQGEQGLVTIPNAQAGVMIQSEGETWRLVRDRDYRLYASYALLGMIALLALFFALRGRVRIDGGPSGVRIRRFGALERFTHWMTAFAFVVLALSGLNLMFGRTLLIPLIGKEAFAALDDGCAVQRTGKRVVSRSIFQFPGQIGESMVEPVHFQLLAVAVADQPTGLPQQLIVVADQFAKRSTVDVCLASFNVVHRTGGHQGAVLLVEQIRI